MSSEERKELRGELDRWQHAWPSQVRALVAQADELAASLQEAHNSGDFGSGLRDRVILAECLAANLRAFICGPAEEAP